jgi:hypothetical protein
MLSIGIATLLVKATSQSSDRNRRVERPVERRVEQPGEWW